MGVVDGRVVLSTVTLPADEAGGGSDDNDHKTRTPHVGRSTGDRQVAARTRIYADGSEANCLRSTFLKYRRDRRACGRNLSALRGLQYGW